MSNTLKDKEKSSAEHSGSGFIPKPFAEDFSERVEAAWSKGFPDLPFRGIPLFALMDEVANLTQQFHRQCLKPLGYTHTDYVILATLLFNGGKLKPSLFTQLLSNASAATSQTLNKLEKQGLLVREASEQDKRSVLVGLTEKGRQVAVQLCEAQANSSALAIQTLSDHELSELRLALSRLVSVLK